MAGPTPKVARPGEADGGAVDEPDGEGEDEPDGEGEAELDPDGAALTGLVEANSPTNNSPIPHSKPRRLAALADGRRRRIGTLAGMAVRTLTSGVGKVNWA